MAIPLTVEAVPDPSAPKPAWFKIRPPSGEFPNVKSALKELGLVTVCEEAHCPNLSECWSGGTATFMVLGDTCTRGCRFCAVSHAVKGKPLDLDEPRKLAEAIRRWKLGYVVITSVDRDDLPDQGAGHFAECIREIRKQLPSCIVEVLTPDFRGDLKLVDMIIEARPDVFAHNIETTRSMQKAIRDPRAGYDQSLSVLKHIKEVAPKIYTKSGVMLGVGETEEELGQAMDDLRKIGVSVFTMGQYLRPSMRHYAVQEYVAPEKFERLKQVGLSKGFLYVAAGPFVRSSYKAGEYFMKNVMTAQGSLSPP